MPDFTLTCPKCGGQTLFTDVDAAPRGVLCGDCGPGNILGERGKSTDGASSSVPPPPPRRAEESLQRLPIAYPPAPPPRPGPIARPDARPIGTDLRMSPDARGLRPETAPAPAPAPADEDVAMIPGLEDLPL